MFVILQILIKNIAAILRLQPNFPHLISPTLPPRLNSRVRSISEFTPLSEDKFCRPAFICGCKGLSVPIKLCRPKTSRSFTEILLRTLDTLTSFHGSKFQYTYVFQEKNIFCRINLRAQICNKIGGERSSFLKRSSCNRTIS